MMVSSGRCLQWADVTLNDICKRITDGSHSSPESVEDGMPMASVKDLTPFGINIESCRQISNEDYFKLVRQGCQPLKGDVLIAKDGATALDTVCVVKKSLDVVLLSSVAILRPDHTKIIPSFLRYYLDSEMTRSYMKGSFITGAAIPRVVLKDFKLARIKVPPLATQRKIAVILSAYDDLIENNLRRIKILETTAQNLYREWFVKFRFHGYQQARFTDSTFGMIPVGWGVKRLDQVIAFQNNGTEAGEHLSDRVYLPIDCIPRKSLAISEIGSWKDAQSSLHLFDAGDILFGAMRPYFHKVVVAPFKGVTRKTCFVFKSALPEYHAFSALALFQDSTVSFANAHSKGSTIPYAVWPHSMDGMPIVVPDIEQANKFEDIVGPMIARIGTMFFQNTTLCQTRDLLLPRLISGEVDVSELDITVAQEAGV